MKLTFEWDEEKAARNVRKHRVSFDEAKTVFRDPLSITVPDTEHSVDELRLAHIGCSARQRVLVVVFAERGTSIRIISCRKATRIERHKYEEDR